MAKPDIHALATRYVILQKEKPSNRWKASSRVLRAMTKRFGQRDTTRAINQARSVYKLLSGG